MVEVIAKVENTVPEGKLTFIDGSTFSLGLGIQIGHKIYCVPGLCKLPTKIYFNF